MKKIAGLLLSTASLSLLFSGIALAENDMDGSKDHPLFNRLPGTYICQYQDLEFDAILSGTKRNVRSMWKDIATSSDTATMRA